MWLLVEFQSSEITLHLVPCLHSHTFPSKSRFIVLTMSLQVSKCNEGCANTGSCASACEPSCVSGGLRIPKTNSDQNVFSAERNILRKWMQHFTQSR